MYLSIIPPALMGSDSVAHEVEGFMGYLLRSHEGKRNNCFRQIQLVGQKNIATKHVAQVKARLKSFFLAAINQNAALIRPLVGFY